MFPNPIAAVLHWIKDSTVDCATRAAALCLRVFVRWVACEILSRSEPRHQDLFKAAWSSKTGLRSQAVTHSVCSFCVRERRARERRLTPYPRERGREGVRERPGEREGASVSLFWTSETGVLLHQNRQVGGAAVATGDAVLRNDAEGSIWPPRMEKQTWIVGVGEVRTHLSLGGGLHICTSAPSSPEPESH